MDYDEIGYRKPPKQSRFQKGRSGNPKGRPKGRLSLRAELDKLLNCRITVPGGRNRVMTAEQVLLLRILNDAIKGDAKKAAIILKLVQTTDDELQVSQETPLREQDVELLQEFIAKKLEQQRT